MDHDGNVWHWLHLAEDRVSSLGGQIKNIIDLPELDGNINSLTLNSTIAFVSWVTLGVIQGL